MDKLMELIRRTKSLGESPNSSINSSIRVNPLFPYGDIPHIIVNDLLFCSKHNI